MCCGILSIEDLFIENTEVGTEVREVKQMHLYQQEVTLDSYF